MVKTKELDELNKAVKVLQANKFNAYEVAFADEYGTIRILWKEENKK